jgi:TonB-linked SusC/RagA family outer membrane protein
MIFLLLVGAGVSYANDTYSQSTKLSLSLKNKTIKEVFSEIERNSEYIFLYSDENLDVTKKVSVIIHNQTIDKILEEVFRNTNNTYYISDRQVFISKSKDIVAEKNKEQTEQAPVQQITITGTVTDAEGELLIGVTVKLKSQPNKGVATDQHGAFSIETGSMNETLVFTYVGMKTMEMKLKAGVTNYKIVMETSEAELSAVVVETGIIQRNKLGFTGSYKTVDREELLSVGNINVLQSLATLDPAFNIAENYLRGSDPNQLANISLRGGSTMNITNVLNDQSSNPNEPLFILDGFETTLQIVNDLDINRIESITILKDAGSTAIYGSKGGNGVVVIETIKPKAGELQINYGGTFRISTADLSEYNMMNAAEKLQYEVLAKRYGDINDYTGNSDRIALYTSHLEQVKRGVDTYWLKVPLRTGLTQAHSLDVSGGNSSFLYQVGVNYKNDEGVMKDSYRQSFGGNMRLTYRKNNISISNNLTATFTNGHTGAWASDFSSFAKANPYYEMQNADGTIPMVLDSYKRDENYPKTDSYNPLYNAMLASRNDTKNQSIANNLSFNWYISEQLRWQASASIESTTSDGVDFKDPKHTSFIGRGDYTQKGEYSSSKGQNWQYNVNTTLNYVLLLQNAHNLTFTGRASAQSRQVKGESYMVTGFPGGVEGIPSYSYGYKENSRPGYSESINRQASFLIAFNYNYKYRYLFDFNYNADGTTAFGRNRKFQNFWSIGTGWNLHKEEFAKNWTLLKELKFRGSYGINGNQNVTNFSTNVYDYYSGNDIFGTASYLSGYANPDLKWQVVAKTSAGINAVTSRVSATIDVYRTKTDPMVVDLDQKLSSGVSRHPVNMGYVQNHGFEFAVGYYIIHNAAKQISLSVRLTGNAYNGKYGGFSDALHNLNEAFKTEKDADGRSLTKELNKNSLVRFQDGYSPTALWAVRSLGIDPATGREVFLTKEGIPTNIYNLDDRVVVADSKPDINGIFGISFKYKNLIAGINFRYNLGGYKFNSDLFSKVENISSTNIVYNQDRRALYDRWQKPGDVAQFKKIDDVTNPVGTQVSSRFIQRNSYFSAESGQISWDFSRDRWLKSTGLKNLLVNISVGDLFRLSTIRMERSTQYPFARSVSMGIRAGF